MKFISLRWRIKKLGLTRVLVYLFCRLTFKLQLFIIGSFACRFAKLHKNRIVFKNRQFQDYSDNALALSEYLQEHEFNEKYEIIWMVSDRKKFQRLQFSHVRFVTAENKFGWSSPAACWYGATAGYFFFTNHSGQLNRYHCNGQITINLWHGCGYKANDNTAKAGGNAQQSNFDYALVPGPVFIKSKAIFWSCPEKKLLPIGYPRYDWMLYPRYGRELISKRFNIQSFNTCTWILWLPTFRKSSQWEYPENAMVQTGPLPGLRDIDELIDLNLFCEENNIFIIVKRHPLEQEKVEKLPDLNNILFLTDANLVNLDVRLQELLAVSDALISDYSSVAVDYMLLDKPIGFILADYQLYQSVRGFVFDNPLLYMPGERIHNNIELKRFLAHIISGEDQFRQQRRQLMPQMHNQTKCYCERIVKYLDL